MAVKLAGAVLAATMGTCGPALGGMGPSHIFADSFQTVDPAWGPLFGATQAISGGQFRITVAPGKEGGSFYGSLFIDSGDYCVDITSPAVANTKTVIGGLVF